MRKGFLKQNSLPILSFCKSHFGLQLSSNSLNSSGAEPELNPAPHFSRTKVMIPMRTYCRASLTCLFTLAIFAMPAAASRLTLPPETPAILDQIYSFDLDGAAEAAKHMEQERPNHPLGYLLEAEALWWRIWCATADFKYGMSDARRRTKLTADQHYLELAARAASLAEAEIKQHESAEMQFYAGMADATTARLYGLRAENRNAARAGVRAREHLLLAKALDTDLADADLGLGLYNYYVDTLSALAKILRFFMGIPGGSKQEGIRQLERAMTQGVLVREDARFYLAKNLRNYDQQYQRALEILEPLVRQYPSNPAFLLLEGDLYAKLNRKPQAAESFRAAAALPLRDPNCRQHIAELARASLAALDLPAT